MPSTKTVVENLALEVGKKIQEAEVMASGKVDDDITAAMTELQLHLVQAEERYEKVANLLAVKGSEKSFARLKQLDEAHKETLGEDLIKLQGIGSDVQGIHIRNELVEIITKQMSVMGETSLTELEATSVVRPQSAPVSISAQLRDEELELKHAADAPVKRRESEPAPQSGVSAMLPGFNKALQGTVVAATMVPQVPSVDSPKSTAGEEQRKSIFQILQNNHDTQRWKWQIVNKDDGSHCKATLSDKTTIEINRGEITCAGTAEGDKAFVAAAAALNPEGKIIIQYRNDPSGKKLEALAKLCKKAGLEPILAHSPDQYKTLKNQYETEAAEQLKNKPKSPGQS